jgi:hypothetical protein
MGKKLLIIISIGLIICTGIYKALFSTNFLFPKQMCDSEINDIFKSGIAKDLKTVYSFGNFKNHVSYHDIDGQIRCRVWKFNEYSSLPLYEKSDRLDSIKITNYVDNSYGSNPSLTVFNKQFNSFSENPILRLDKYSKIIAENKTDSQVDLYGRFISFGLYDNNQCEIKILFDKLTLARLKFIKKGDDYFIIIYYGINDYEINEHDEIINSI